MQKLSYEDREAIFNTHYKVGVGAVGGKYFGDIFTPEELEGVFSDDARVLARHVINGVLIPIADEDLPAELQLVPEESGLDPNAEIEAREEAERSKAAIEATTAEIVKTNKTRSQTPDPKMVSGNNLVTPSESAADLKADGKAAPVAAGDSTVSA